MGRCRLQSCLERMIAAEARPEWRTPRRNRQYRKQEIHQIRGKQSMQRGTDQQQGTGCPECRQHTDDQAQARNCNGLEQSGCTVRTTRVPHIPHTGA